MRQGTQSSPRAGKAENKTSIHRGVISLSRKYERDRSTAHMCTYTHTFTHWGYFHGAAAFLEEGHRVKGRKEGRGQVQWHPEQRRFIEKGNDKHSADGNSIRARTARPPASPPAAPQTLLGRRIHPLQIPSSGTACIWSSSCWGRGAELWCFGLHIHLCPRDGVENAEQQQEEAASAPASPFPIKARRAVG